MIKDYTAIKNSFVKIARKTQSQLKIHVTDGLKRAGYDVIVGDGFVYGRGSDVLLTAHMDTVHVKNVKKVYTMTEPDDIWIASPQGIGGDDRCGVWAVFDVLQKLTPSGVRPSVLFCEDEEIGGVGSGKFCKTEYIKELSALRYLIEIDRKGSNDAVFYEDCNTQFQKYIQDTTGHKLAYGSFSDISTLCPACGRSGVNLSSGYYYAHTTNEIVSCKEMAHTADVIVNLIKHTIENDVQPFDYVDTWADYDRYGLYNGAFSRYGSGLQDDYISGAVFCYYDENGMYKEDYVDGCDFAGAVGTFLMEHSHMSWADIVDYEVY